MQITLSKPSICFWSAFALACLWLFWPGLIDSKISGFRDAYQFYLPQAVWLDQCAARGDFFPQWQADEALGVSLPGETTSALYYPLRAIWLLRVFSVPQRMALFMVAHLWIAAAGMVYACRRLGLRCEAGWLAGAGFALSCPVLFQHNNLVFLCSAAWLGFALAELACGLTVNSSINRRPRWWVLGLSIALMVLAGDPHTAVNITALAAVVGGLQSITHRSWLLLKSWGFGLSAALLLAAGLSAIQWIPSGLWSLQSHRWLGNEISIATAHPFPAAEQDVPRELTSLLAAPSPLASQARYEFSLSPWHLLTAVWPTLGGNFTPENSRLFSYIPAEGRMWIPSLFFGVVPILLIVGGLKKSPQVRRELFNWVLFGATFALLAAMGNYSLGWMLRCLLTQSGATELAQQLPADHYTSLYGLLSECVPGYAAFRYPAKWTVISVACLALAAAVSLDRSSEWELLRPTTVHRVVLSTSCVLAVGAIGLFAATSLSEPSADALADFMKDVLPDAWLGTPSAAAMRGQLAFAICLPIGVLASLATLRWRFKCSLTASPGTPFPAHRLLAFICLLELSIVATSWCSFIAVPKSHPSSPWTAEFIWSNARAADIGQDRWLEHAANRQIAVAAYQQQFELGKMALLNHRHNLASTLSIEPERLKRLRSGLGRLDNLSQDQPQLDRVLAWLGVERRLVRTRTTGQPATFDLVAIPNPRPMCELLDAVSNDSSSVRWQWLATGQLEVIVDSPSSGKLLVRQFDDGLWQATVSGDSSTSTHLARDPTGLFIETAYSAGHTSCILSRKRWPQRLGLAVSLGTLLTTCGLLAILSRSYCPISAGQLLRFRRRARAP